jgi:hypothetical protein
MQPVKPEDIKAKVDRFPRRKTKVGKVAVAQ